jgi:hypothetical protein
MSTTVLESFSTDWARLCACGTADTALGHWGRREPGLAVFGDVTELMAELDRAGADADYTRSDALLHALVSVAGTGGSPARAAALLVAARMMPATRRTVGQLLSAARRCGRSVAVTDAQTTVAGCLWEQIRTSPLERHQKVAANLAAEVLAQSLRTYDCHPRCTGRAIPMDPADLAHPAPAADPHASEELLRLLSWAVGVHYVSRAQADLLLARWSPPTARNNATTGPVPTRVLGAQWGLAQRTVARRCTQAEAALTVAARQAFAAA